MTNLPHATPKFQGEISRLVEDSVAVPLENFKAQKKLPNILLIMLDDVGFGSPETFGGPGTDASRRAYISSWASASTSFTPLHYAPLLEQLYSPDEIIILSTWAASLRLQISSSGYDSAIPPETASIAKNPKETGYSTSCFGKWHLTPSWEQRPCRTFRPVADRNGL